MSFNYCTNLNYPTLPINCSLRPSTGLVTHWLRFLPPVQSKIASLRLRLRNGGYQQFRDKLIVCPFTLSWKFLIARTLGFRFKMFANIFSLHRHSLYGATLPSVATSVRISVGFAFYSTTLPLNVSSIVFVYWG